jgi:hypothetical protein
MQFPRFCAECESALALHHRGSPEMLIGITGFWLWWARSALGEGQPASGIETRCHAHGACAGGDRSFARNHVPIAAGYDSHICLLSTRRTNETALKFSGFNGIERIVR